MTSHSDGSEHGYYDDAIHILHPSQTHTLCDEKVREGLNVVRIYARRPDTHSGCWTCLSVAEHDFPMENES